MVNPQILSQEEDAFAEILSPKNKIQPPADLAAWKAAQKKQVIEDVNQNIANVMKTIEKVELEKQDSGKPPHSFRRVTHKEDDPVATKKSS